jgi:hypothetical protein
VVTPAELTGILGDLAEVGSLEFNVDTYISALSWIRETKLTVKSSSDSIFGRSEDHLALDRGIIGGPIILAHFFYSYHTTQHRDTRIRRLTT